MQDTSPPAAPWPGSGPMDFRGGARRRSLRWPLLAVLLAMAVVGYLVMAHARPLISRAELRGERALILPKDGARVAPGERLRLDLTLARPCAVLVLLQDPHDAVAEVHPPPGEEARPSGPSLRLPPGNEAWETADLNPGLHIIWIVVSPETIPPERRNAAARSIEDAAEVLGGPRGSLFQHLKAEVRKALATEGFEAQACPFVVEGPQFAVPGK